MQVNGKSLVGCTHNEAVNALRSVKDDITILICDGFCDVSAGQQPSLTSSQPLTADTNTLVSTLVPRAGSGVVKIDLLHFLAGCRKRQLYQALSVLYLT